MFKVRRNIKKNLDSTRCTTPKQTEKPDNEVFKTPVVRPARVARLLAEKLNDCEDVNASDDSDVDDTFNAANSLESLNSSSSSDDGKNVPRKKKGKGSKNKENINTTNESNKSRKADDLIYLDLTKEEISIITSPCNSPPANHDAKFDQHLEDILRTCRAEEKPKLGSITKSNTKRRLFTANFGLEDEHLGGIQTPPQRTLKPTNLAERLREDSEIVEEESIRFQGQLLPPGFELLNKPLESVKKGKPIFKLTTPKTPRAPAVANTAKSHKKNAKPFQELRVLNSSGEMKYTFLKSLESK